MKNRKNIVAITKPVGFCNEKEACSCYVEYDKKLLFLQKAKDRWAEFKWTIPCGRREETESLMDCMIRELFEETFIKISENELSSVKYITTLFVCHTEANWLFHMFQYKPSKLPLVTLSTEHINYTWLEKSKIEEIDLCPGGFEAFHFYEKLTKSHF